MSDFSILTTCVSVSCQFDHKRKKIEKRSVTVSSSPRRAPRIEAPLFEVLVRLVRMNRHCAGRPQIKMKHSNLYAGSTMKFLSQKTAGAGVRSSNGGWENENPK